MSLLAANVLVILSFYFLKMDNSQQTNETTETNLGSPSQVTQSPIASSVQVEGKCSFRSCHIRDEIQFKCASKGCGQFLHFRCYIDFVVNKFLLTSLDDTNVVACTKGCYLKAAKELASDDPGEGRRKGNWDSDGKNGLTDVNTSMKSNSAIGWLLKCQRKPVPRWMQKMF